MSEVSVIKGARDLRRAFNAALARIIDSGEFLEIKNRTGMDEVIACITCAPDSTQSVFPMKDSLTGRMVDIIDVMPIVDVHFVEARIGCCWTSLHRYACR